MVAWGAWPDFAQIFFRPAKDVALQSALCLKPSSMSAFAPQVSHS